MARLLKGRQKAKSTLVLTGEHPVNGGSIPFEVRVETRRNTRFSLTSKKAFLRVPNGLPKAQLVESLAEFKAWLAKAVAAKPSLLDPHQVTSYESGQVWELGEHRFRLFIAEGDLQGASAKTVGRADEDGIVSLSLKLPLGASEKDKAELVEKLLYKVAGSRAQASIQSKLNQLNEAYFKVGVTRLKLSPTRSRWGSCSTTGTISISSRLLGAPSRCLQAVLIHELAHRIEMNHSDRFWKLVYDAMPDYDAAHSWLKENGGKLGWELV